MTSNKAKIMVVDDQPSMLESMAGILELEGYDVIMAENGSKAVEKAKKNVIDFIFLDIRMPGMNGLETFREIKKITPQTVVFMMTAFAEEEIISQALQEGVYTCLNKPFNIENLLKSIETVLKASS